MHKQLRLLFITLFVFLSLYLHPLVQRAVYVVLLIFVVCHCQISVTFILKWCHIKRSMGGNLLVLDELCSRSLVHNWLSVVFLAAVVAIGHTQVGLTADHEWIPCASSTTRNGLEKKELGTIPFINKRVSVVGTSRVVASRSEECVTIDNNRLNVICTISLKRL